MICLVSIVAAEAKEYNTREGNSVMKAMKECEEDGFIRFYAHAMSCLGEDYGIMFSIVMSFSWECRYVCIIGS